MDKIEYLKQINKALKEIKGKHEIPDEILKSLATYTIEGYKEHPYGDGCEYCGE